MASIKAPAAGPRDGTPEAVAHGLDALVAWAVNVGTADIPPAALSRAALVIADNVAVAISSRDEAEVKAQRSRLLARARNGEATIFAGGRDRIDRFGAAVMNAMAMTTAEFDEGYQLSPCHAGLYTVPTALAEGEASSISVRELLRAEVLAYEITTRIARAWTTPAGAYPPLYTHARFAALGATCASCLVQGLPSEIFRQALDIAATLVTAGPRNHLMQGALVRNIWPATGAWSGMMSAEWAACGVTALRSSQHDVFAGLFGFVGNARQLSGGLGEDWGVLHGYHRMYACHLFFSGMIEAALEIRHQIGAGVDSSDIDAVTVKIHRDAFDLPRHAPVNSLQARFSVAHVLAAALIDGHANPSCFTAHAVSRPDLVALRDKIRVAPFEGVSDGVHKWPACVTVSRAGRDYRVERLSARGGHGEPHSIDDVLAKIDALTAPVHPAFASVFRELVHGSERLLGAPCTELIGIALR